jgi:hypothetical protein
LENSILVAEKNRGVHFDFKDQIYCVPTDEWIKKMWYICTKEFYSTIKKSKSMFFSGKWMELENIILSEMN